MRNATNSTFPTALNKFILKLFFLCPRHLLNFNLLKHSFCTVLPAATLFDFCWFYGTVRSVGYSHCKGQIERELELVVESFRLLA